MSERKDNPIQYPGPEMFWRQAPELMGMQDDLAQLWKQVETLPRVSEQDLLSGGSGNLIGVKQVGGHMIFIDCLS